MSVLGELCSTSRIANILPVCLSLSFGLNTLSCVYHLFLVCGCIFLVDGKKSGVWFTVLFVLIVVCVLFSLSFCFTSVLVGHACISFQCPKMVCVQVLVCGVLFRLFSSISGLLWRFCSKNLIGPVWSGKPLGLFSVTWPYAWFWHLMHLMGRQAPLNLSLAWY